MRSLFLISCLLLLSACDGKDIRFCKAWAKASAGQGAELHWLETTVSDRPLTSLEAKKTVFPNYDPQAHFKRRPGNSAKVLYALEVLAIDLRRVDLTAKRASSHERSEKVQYSCRFLVVDGRAQFISDGLLHDLSTNKITADGSRAKDCCIQTNEDVI